MAFFNGFSTRRLTATAFELAPGQRLRKLALLGLVFAVVVALAGLALRYVVDSAAPAARLAELEHDNGQLRIELDQYRVQLEMERATRGVYSVLRAAVARGADELALASDARLIVDPDAQVEARPIEFGD